MAKDDHLKRSKGAKALSLLNRFPVTDLAKAVSLSASARREFLIDFVEHWTARTYEPTRRTYHMIYGASPPLIQIPVEPWDEIEKNIVALADDLTLEMNIAASREVFNLIRPRGYIATTCDVQVFRAGHNQVVPIELTFYLTEGDRLIFQFPQLRMDRLYVKEAQILGSVIFHAYANGDYAAAEIEIAEVGRAPGEPKASKRREGEIYAIPRGDILEREPLGEQIDDVYDILRELVTRTPYK